MPEAAFRLTGLERYSIQEQFIIRDAEQKAAVSGRGQTLLQFIPGDFELRFRPLMFVAVHPGVLDQNVQAVNKGSRRCRPIGMECTCVRDKALLELHSASKRLNPDSKGVHITEVTGNSPGSPLMVCIARNRKVSRVKVPGTLAVTGHRSKLRRI